MMAVTGENTMYVRTDEETLKSLDSVHKMKLNTMLEGKQELNIACSAVSTRLESFTLCTA